MQQPANRRFSGIFICYRRDDSAGYAGRLYDRLSAHFGEDNVFMDIDYIKPGDDYVQIIEEAVGSCEILLTIIGKRWLSSSDGASRRLDKPHDFVRLEIAAALDRDVRVIPILVQGASMPEPHLLPDDLSKLSRRQAHELSDVRWKHDIERLTVSLERILAERQEAHLKAARAEEEQRRQAESEEAKRRSRQAAEAETRRREMEAAESARRAAEAEEEITLALEDEVPLDTPRHAPAPEIGAVTQSLTPPGAVTRPLANSSPAPATSKPAAWRARSSLGLLWLAKRRWVWALVAVALLAIVAGSVSLWPKTETEPTVNPSPEQPAVINANMEPAPVPTPLASPAPTPTRKAKSEVNNFGMKLVWIPSGEFEMGSNGFEDDETPKHTVTIARGFYMGETEVTQGQWREVTKEAPPGFQGEDDMPVAGASWFEAVAFIKKLNARDSNFTYRLPSEAEWEYACRARKPTDSSRNLEGVAWYVDTIGKGTTVQKVRRLSPNGFGLYDMQGNVWGWTQDYYHDNYKNNPPTDGSPWLRDGDINQRVIRGGSWNSYAHQCRCANRVPTPPNAHGPIEGTPRGGFRVVATRK